MADFAELARLDDETSPLKDIIKRALDKRSGGLSSPALRGLLLNVADYLVGREEIEEQTVTRYIKRDRHFPCPRHPDSLASSMYASSIYTDYSDDVSEAGSTESDNSSKSASTLSDGKKYCNCNEQPREKKPRIIKEQTRVKFMPYSKPYL